MNISNTNRGGILIIDESLDCIDSNNFELLPKLMNLVKMYYSTIILISHRRIDNSIIDNDISISRRGNYSVIL